MPQMPLVWLITGTSSGIGRCLAIAALKRGDRVIATTRARSMPKLEDLRLQGAEVLELDVTAPVEAIREIAQAAVGIYGKVDVVVNNAGFAHVAACEELTAAEDFATFNTNLLGAINVARAFLPYMRKEKTGTILWIGSLTAWTTSLGGAAYGGSKAAMRAVSETMDAEVAHLGLRSIVVECGYFTTEMMQNTQYISGRIADYDPLMDPVRAGAKALHGAQPGDPEKGADIIVDLVHGEGVAAGRTVPSVIGLGADYYREVTEYCKNMLQHMEEWRTVTCSTDHINRS